MKPIATFFIYSLMFSEILSVVGVANAEGMKVKPGLWETKSIVSLPFGRGEQEHTSQDCITESEITPEKLMKDAEGCQVLNASVDTNAMRWTINCQNEGVEMVGKGAAESTGTTITGGMDISATFNGQEMNMNTQWEGVYIGECI